MRASVGLGSAAALLACGAHVDAAHDVPPSAKPPVAGDVVTPRDDTGTAVDVTDPPPTPAIVDLDGDGLDDVAEGAMARAYLPYLSTHSQDDCPLSGLVFRVHSHPDDARFVAIVYSRLYQRDCGVVAGIGGHVGDDEAFGITIDPSVAAPAGIIAMVAVSHQNTTCERDTVCGICPGLDACDTGDLGGAQFPVVYASKDKHASAVSLAHGCSLFGSCFDRCELAPATIGLPMVNVGEPDHPLVHDLTTDGFIKASDGWTESSLQHYDPWGPSDFGTAGVVSGDMVDPAFVAPVCAGS